MANFVEKARGLSNAMEKLLGDMMERRHQALVQSERAKKAEALERWADDVTKSLHWPG